MATGDIISETVPYNSKPINLIHLAKKDKLFERNKLPKLTQEEIDNLNTSAIIKEISCSLQKKKKTHTPTPGTDGFAGEFHQCLRKKYFPIHSIRPGLL